MGTAPTLLLASNWAATFRSVPQWRGTQKCTPFLLWIWLILSAEGGWLQYRLRGRSPRQLVRNHQFIE